MNLDLQSLNTKELNDLIITASTILEHRHEKRKLELWGNVVKAMRKYCEEFELIEVRPSNSGNNYSLFIITTADCNTPGHIEV